MLMKPWKLLELMYVRIVAMSEIEKLLKLEKERHPFVLYKVCIGISDIIHRQPIVVPVVEIYWQLQKQLLITFVPIRMFTTLAHILLTDMSTMR